MIRVLLADDEPMIRAGCRAILTQDATVEIVAEAGDGREAVELARRHRPDVALLDIRMPRLDGLGAAAEIRRAVPSAAIMMLTTFSEDDLVARALGEGASGFVLKTGDPRDLITGVRAVAEGGAYLSPAVARRIITRVGSELTRGMAARDRLAALTARERDVLGLLAAGLSNAEIAARLHLVEGTVKAHVSAILAGLGVRNRVQAAMLAYRAGVTGDAGAAGPADAG